MAVGALTLSLADVEDPDWLDAGTLRYQIARLQEQLRETTHRLDAARGAAVKANGEAKRTRNGLTAAEGRLKARREDTNRLEAQLEDLGRQADAQMKKARNELQGQVKSLGRRIEELAGEIEIGRAHV